MAPSPFTIDEVFDPDFLADIQALTLHVRRLKAGGRLAEHASKGHGSGTEFVDLKPYSPGDDLRAFDWKIYNRLGKLFVKVFEEKQDLPVYFLIDISGSMFADDGRAIKAAFKTALGLASIALGQQDQISLHTVSQDSHTALRKLQGQRNLMQFARALCELPSEAETDLAQSIGRFNNQRRRPGLLILLSDFFDPNGLDGLDQALRSSVHQKLFIQIVDPVDGDPGSAAGMTGDVRLVDPETSAELELNLSASVLAEYKEVYAQFQARIDSLAISQSAGLLRINVDEDIAAQLTQFLFARGVTV